MSNSIGRNLVLTTFGESHGPAMGGVLDGFPSGISINFDSIRDFLSRRRPGGQNVSQRKEDDEVEFLSGITPDGITLGTPIGFIVRNIDAKSADYEKMRDIYRPNHADFTYDRRYHIRDYRGGGRASARETVSRVVAGALAKHILDLHNVKVEAELIAVGDSAVGATKAQLMEKIEEIRLAKDSIGGVVECRITGMEPGYGNPVYDKLSQRLAAAMMSINAAMGFEYGRGFEAAKMTGSQMADPFTTDKNGNIFTTSNNCGGIQGGISNGNDIVFRVAFKPTPTIGVPLATVKRDGSYVNLQSHGRHDPCVAVRAVPVVEAMAILTIADFLIGR